MAQDKNEGTDGVKALIDVNEYTNFIALRNTNVYLM